MTDRSNWSLSHTRRSFLLSILFSFFIVFIFLVIAILWIFSLAFRLCVSEVGDRNRVAASLCFVLLCFVVFFFYNLSPSRLWPVNCELINGFGLCAKLKFCSGSSSSFYDSLISSTSKVIWGRICKCVESIGVKSSNELISLTTPGPQRVHQNDELGWTMDDSWRWSILIFMASLFVLSAWLGLENEVDKRGLSLGLLGWISSFKSNACVDSWTALR